MMVKIDRLLLCFTEKTRFLKMYAKIDTYKHEFKKKKTMFNMEQRGKNALLLRAMVI
jgi:hypothetical protein